MVSAEIAAELVTREAKKLMPNLFKVVQGVGYDANLELRGRKEFLHPKKD